MPRQPKRESRSGPLVVAPPWIRLQRRLFWLAASVGMAENMSEATKKELMDLLKLLNDRPEALRHLYPEQQSSKATGEREAIAVCYWLLVEADKAEGNPERGRPARARCLVAKAWNKSQGYVANQASEFKELAALVTEMEDFLPRLRSEHSGAPNKVGYAAAVRALAKSIVGTTPVLAGRHMHAWSQE
jgi:hypothetical protein